MPLQSIVSIEGVLWSIRDTEERVWAVSWFGITFFTWRKVQNPNAASHAVWNDDAGVGLQTGSSGVYWRVLTFVIPKVWYVGRHVIPLACNCTVCRNGFAVEIEAKYDDFQIVEHNETTSFCRHFPFKGKVPKPHRSFYLMWKTYD
jgi:hypothetical protein